MRTARLAAIAGVGISMAVALESQAGRELVKFPDDYAQGIHYATVTRGNIREELFASRAAVEAARKGEPLPSGTVITMEDYRSGKLYRYIVMEKRTGWGADYRSDKRNGEWEFQAFNADKSVNGAENVDRCFGCHKGQAQTDFVFTRDRMSTAR